MNTFTTASDLWDAAYHRGADGVPLPVALEFFRNHLGTLTDWQTGAVVAGHAFGCQDYVNYLADLAAADPWTNRQTRGQAQCLPPF